MGGRIISVCRAVRDDGHKHGVSDDSSEKERQASLGSRLMLRGGGAIMVRCLTLQRMGAMRVRAADCRPGLGNGGDRSPRSNPDDALSRTTGQKADDFRRRQISAAD